MARYRKKPVVIEAVQFLGAFSWDEIRDAFGEPFEYEVNGEKRVAPPIHEVAQYNSITNELVIETLEGDHRADSRDWIIRGVKGEFYPCKPDIFEATYEPAERGMQSVPVIGEVG